MNLQGVSFVVSATGCLDSKSSNVSTSSKTGLLESLVISNLIHYLVVAMSTGANCLNVTQIVVEKLE